MASENKNDMKNASIIINEFHPEDEKNEAIIVGDENHPMPMSTVPGLGIFSPIFKEIVILIMVLSISWNKTDNNLLKISLLLQLIFCTINLIQSEYKIRIVTLMLICELSILSCIQAGVINEKDPVIWMVSYYLLIIRYYPMLIIGIIFGTFFLISIFCGDWLNRTINGLINIDGNRPIKNPKELLKRLKTFIIPTNSTDECAICIEEYKQGENLKILPCKHKFHQKCLDEWLTTSGKTCPLCRDDIEKALEEKKTDENKNEK